jgi:hypothetical protein
MLETLRGGNSAECLLARWQWLICGTLIYHTLLLGEQAHNVVLPLGADNGARFSLSAFTAYMFLRLMSKKGGRALKGMPRQR